MYFFSIKENKWGVRSSNTRPTYIMFKKSLHCLREALHIREYFYALNLNVFDLNFEVNTYVRQHENKSTHPQFTKTIKHAMIPNDNLYGTN